MRQATMDRWIEAAEARRFCMIERVLAHPETPLPHRSLLKKLRASLMLKVEAEHQDPDVPRLCGRQPKRNARTSRLQPGW
jgi:hypothetical protein